MPYIAGVGSYRRTCEDMISEGYKSFHFEPSKQAEITS
jgi:hypothetical protein